jgi:lysozyme family protein
MHQYLLGLQMKSRELKTNENDRPIDRSPWWIPQLKKTDTSPVERELVGFTTTFSYSPDDTINFKLKTPSKLLKRSDISPDINIYRLGYYDGYGARWRDCLGMLRYIPLKL